MVKVVFIIVMVIGVVKGGLLKMELRNEKHYMQKQKSN